MCLGGGGGECVYRVCMCVCLCVCTCLCVCVCVYMSVCVMIKLDCMRMCILLAYLPCLLLLSVSLGMITNNSPTRWYYVIRCN